MWWIPVVHLLSITRFNFSVMGPFRLANNYHLGCLDPEDKDSIIFRNVGKNLLV